MDIFERQLKELTKANTGTISNDKGAVSDHCKHVAVKLLRKLKNGTRGSLEVRYLLEDLLHNLPAESFSNGSSSDPYRDIRAFAKLFTSKDGVDIPLKAKPKRPASVDAASLVNHAKRSRANGLEDARAIQQELENVQLLYDIFNDIQRYTTSGKKLSMTQILSEALSSGSVGRSSDPSANSLSTTNSDVSKLDLMALQLSIEALLPPAPRGQALRDRLNAFRKLHDLNSRPAYSRKDTEAYLDCLEETVDILARLCAPIRDGQVKTLRDALATCRQYLSTDGTGTKYNKFIQTAEEELQSLVADMQRDLRLFNLGITVSTRDEAELQRVIRKESMVKERKIITRLYLDPLQQTKDWVDQIKKGDHPVMLSRFAVAQCLVEALFRTQPVEVQADPSRSTSENQSSSRISSTPNVLPPIFHFAAKHLFLMQNRLQALTILATLSTLVPSSYARPSTNNIIPSTGKDDDGEVKSASWSERVWILLTSEIQDDQGNTTSSEIHQSHVKIANLADEIVSVLRNGMNSESIVIDEAKIRSSVDRMLRLEDRVFALLHNRLKSAFGQAIVKSSDGGVDIEVKGFNVAPLPTEINVTVKQMRGIVNWACECWGITDQSYHVA